MDLHGKIMNLPIDPEKHFASFSAADRKVASKLGHRDARHAAAELVAAAPERDEQLYSVLAEYLTEADGTDLIPNHVRVRNMLERLSPNASHHRQ